SPKDVRRPDGDADPRVEQHAEGQENDQLADEPELLAEDREDEVRVRVRNVHPFLAARAESDAEPAAGPQGDQRLLQLVPRAQRIRARVEEREEPGPPVALAE